MFVDTVSGTNNPAELCAAVAEQPKRTRRTIKKTTATSASSDAPFASSANEASQPSARTRDGTLTDDGHGRIATHGGSAVVGHNNAPFSTATEHHEALIAIQEFYRLRVDMIRARTKLILQAQASLRSKFAGDKEMAAKVYSEAAKDPEHEFRPRIEPYLLSLDVLDKQQTAYEKEMVKALKALPILKYAKGVKGFGDMSLACIIGEATGFRNDDGAFYSVGDFKSVSALWKRMGLAVLGGVRQGNPGKGASADDWIVHGYNKSRRSVMWNIGNSLILSMGKFRPMFGENIDANAEYTELQKVFANRARYEQAKLGKEVAESKTGKDSYSAHAANRAKRYTEKRLLRNLYGEWRRVMA